MPNAAAERRNPPARAPLFALIAFAAAASGQTGDTARSQWIALTKQHSVVMVLSDQRGGLKRLPLTAKEAAKLVETLRDAPLELDAFASVEPPSALPAGSKPLPMPQAWKPAIRTMFRLLPVYECAGKVMELSPFAAAFAESTEAPFRTIPMRKPYPEAERYSPWFGVGKQAFALGVLSAGHDDQAESAVREAICHSRVTRITD